MFATRAPLAIVVALLLGACSASPAPAPEAGKPPPRAELRWPAPSNVEARIREAGLTPQFKDAEQVHGERLAAHTHAHLEVFRRGRQIVVPSGLGLAPGLTSPVHTHKADGVIHVELDTTQEVRLWQFFALWDVSLEGATVYVEGERVSDPANVVLKDQQLVTVMFQ